MGWSDCGTDSKGRPIGYVYPATCDHPECNEEIHRGLAYACGGMHGEDELSCEGYFREQHRTVVLVEGDYKSLCHQCDQLLIDSGDWRHDDEEGCTVEVDQ